MPGNKIALILAFICAAIASVIVYNTLKEGSKVKVIESPKKPVVFAKTNIPARSVIDGDQLEIRMIPEEAVGSNAATKIEELTGLITKADLIQGEQVNVNRLVKVGEKIGLSFVIPPGMRALTIAINEVVGVAGFIKIGERVDIIGTLEPKDSPVGTISWTVAQNLEVLAVSQEMGDPVIKAEETESAKKKKGTKRPQKAEAKIGTSVTLAVTPQQAERIALAGERGVLRLILRPVLEEPLLDIPPIDEMTIFTQNDLPKPSISPSPSPTKVTRVRRIKRRSIIKKRPVRRIEVVSGPEIKVIKLD